MKIKAISNTNKKCNINLVMEIKDRAFLISYVYVHSIHDSLSKHLKRQNRDHIKS